MKDGPETEELTGGTSPRASRCTAARWRWSIRFTAILSACFPCSSMNSCRCRRVVECIWVYKLGLASSSPMIAWRKCDFSLSSSCSSSEYACLANSFAKLARSLRSFAARERMCAFGLLFLLFSGCCDFFFERCRFFACTSTPLNLFVLPSIRPRLLWHRPATPPLEHSICDARCQMQLGRVEGIVYGFTIVKQFTRIHYVSWVLHIIRIQLFNVNTGNSRALNLHALFCTFS